MTKGNYSNIELLSLMDSIYSHGYESILLAFQIDNNDPIVSAGFLASKYPNIRYMIAIRPYTVSYMHLSLIAKTFYEYYNNKLIINFVAGTHDEEYNYFTGKTSSIQERKKMLKEYVDSFINNADGKSYSDIAISGFSKESSFSSKDSADICIGLLSDLDKIDKDSLGKRIMVRVSIGLNIEKDNAIFDSEREYNNSICGSKEFIINELCRIESLGVTDILVSSLFSRTSDIDSIHKIIEEFKTYSIEY